MARAQSSAPGAFLRWRELLGIKTTQLDEYGETVVALAEE